MSDPVTVLDRRGIDLAAEVKQAIWGLIDGDVITAVLAVEKRERGEAVRPVERLTS